MDDRARRVHSGAFSNANGISFGVTSGKITASYTVPSTTAALTNIKISAGAASALLSALTFSNSNGLAFGLAGSVITGSYTVPAGGGAMSVSAGTSSAAIGSIVFSDASGVSWGLNGSTITASVKTDYQSSGAYLTTAMLSNAATISNIKVSAGTSSTNLSALTFADSNGVSFGLNGSVVTATVQTNYITTARGSTDAIGLNTAKTNVTWTVNSSGLSFDAGGYAGTGFTTASTTGSNIVGTQNTAGLSMGVPKYLTTAMLSNAATISNINVSAGATSGNLSAVTFSDTNGIFFGLNASTITAAGSITISASGVNTVSATSGAAPMAFAISGAGGISIGAAVGGGVCKVTISSPVISDFDPVFGSSLITTLGLGQNSLYFQNFDLPIHLSAYRVNFFHSIGTTLQASNSTQSAGYTFSAAIYTRGAGASTERLNSYWSGSWFVNMNGSSNTQLKVTHPIGISNSTAVSTTSNGTTASSNVSTYLLNSVGGFRAVPMPISLTLTPGRYWMVVANSSNSSNAIGVIGNTVMQQTNQNNINFRPFGTSSAASNASFYGIEPGNGTYSATSGAFPSSVALTTDAIRASPTLTMPYFNFSALTEGTNVL